MEQETTKAVVYAECVICQHQQKVYAGEEGVCKRCFGPLVAIRATLYGKEKTR